MSVLPAAGRGAELEFISPVLPYTDCAFLLPASILILDPTIKHGSKEGPFDGQGPQR